MNEIDDDIPKNADQANKLVAGRSPLEVTVFYPLPVMILTVLFSLRLLGYVGYLAGLAAVFIISTAIFGLIPRGEPVLSWLKRGLTYLRRAPVSAHPTLYDADTSITVRADGGTSSSEHIPVEELKLHPWQNYDAAPDITGIKRIFPDEGFVLRDDDTLVGLVEVEGRDVLLSESANSGRITNQYENVLSQLSRQTDFHIVSDQFDLDDHIEHHRQRLEDQDIADRPLLKECLKEYINFVERNVRSMNLMRRQVYAKRELALNEASNDDDSPFAGIVEPDSPVGRLLNIGDESEQDRLHKRARELERELMQLQDNINSIEGVSASRVTGDDLVELLHDHWNPEYGFEFRSMPVPSPATTGTDGSNLPYAGADTSTTAEEPTIYREPADSTSGDDESSGGWLGFGSSGSGEDTETATFPSQAELDKQLTSASRVHEYTDCVVLNDTTYARTYVVEEWPRRTQEFMLFSLLSEANLEFAATLKVNPLEDVEAVKRFGDLADKFEDKAKGALSSFTLNPEAAEHSAKTCRDLRVAIENGNQSAVEVGLVITVYADSYEDLDDLDNVLTHRLVGDAGVGLSKAVYEQKPALRANSPVGPSELLDQADGRWQIMGTRAASGTFMFISDSLMEDGGVAIGENVAYNSPVFMDIWNREKGYNILRVGDIGSGKSFGAGLFDLRSAMAQPDLNIAIIDPLEGEYTGLNQTIGGERIVINGNESINPLEIKQVSEEQLQMADHELDPYQRKLEEVTWFFDRFYRTQGNAQETLSAQEWGILKQAIVLTYRDAGITRDISTHSKPSPTIQDLRETLQEWVENPAADRFVDTDDESMIQKRKELAEDVLISLDPFKEGGQYHHLAQETEFSLADEQVTYIDMQQLDERGSDLGLMMQLVFSYLWQEARQSDDPWRITIDECHKILSNSSALDFFEETVRASRHFDVSFQWITQTFEEFFHTDDPSSRTAATGAAEVIAKQCGVKIFHRISPVNEQLAKEHLDLEDIHIHHIENVHPGEGDKNYAEALLDIDDSGYSRLRIRPTAAEPTVLDFDPTADPQEETNPERRRLQRLLHYRYDRTPPTVFGEPDDLSDEIRKEIVRTRRRAAQTVLQGDPEALSEVLESLSMAGDLTPPPGMLDAPTDPEAEGDESEEFAAPDAAEMNPAADIRSDGTVAGELESAFERLEPESTHERRFKQKLANMPDGTIQTLAANTDGVDPEAEPDDQRLQLFEEGLDQFGQDADSDTDTSEVEADD